MIVQTHILKPRVAKDLYGVEVDSAVFRKDYVVGRGFLNSSQYAEVGRVVFSGAYPMKSVPAAIPSIKLLRERDGHRLQIVTNRSDEWKSLDPAKAWLKKHGLGDLPITGLPYGTSKASACGDLDVFVDDDPAKLAELADVVPHRLLYRWPQNQHLILPKGVVEVFRWSDIRYRVKDYSGDW